jgi:hypothetical protein
VSTTDPVQIEADCALDFGCDNGVTGSFTGGPMSENGDTTVGYLEAGVTLTYANIPAAGLDTITFYYSKEGGDGTIEIHQDSAAGTLLGTFTPTDTGAWSTWEEAAVTLSAPLSANATIVLVPMPGTTTYVANLDWIELSAGSAQ